MNMAMVPGESAIKKPAGRRADRVENGTSRESSSPSMQACRHGIAIPPPEPSLRMTRARRHARRSGGRGRKGRAIRSEEHTSELQSLMRISYAVFCLKKQKPLNKNRHNE